MKKLSIKLLVLILLISIVFSFLQIFFVKSEVNAAGLSSSYTQYIKSGISAFPESYQKKLAYLKYLHPNWQFKAYYTGIDWSELTSSSAENQCLKNTVSKENFLDPSALCICGRSGDVGYYCASAKMVNYYLDPRNFMGEAMIFQFLDLANGSGVTRDVVASATQGTYLSRYVDDIMSAAQEAQINPLHIVATIFQELGREGTPRAISGTVPGYEGLYNFYNYGATDGSGAVERGLAMARECGWTSPRYALIDGAKKVLANNYISVGQTTKYFYKFDVVGNEILTESAGKKTYALKYFYGHQYMTNLRDPSSQAGSLYDIYADSQILDENLTFTIPVYNNMPDSVAVPSTVSASSDKLYYINSLKKYGIAFRATAGGASIGHLYKDTVVELIQNQGTWSKVRLNRATTYDSANKKWNTESVEGYVATEYLLSINADIPDYRDRVDMGNGNNPGPIIGDANFKVDGNYIVMTPSTTAKTIKSKNTNAVIKRKDGTDISNTEENLATGMSVTIGDKTYVVSKLGDVNEDGQVDIIDLALIKRHLIGTTTLQNQDYRAAKLQNNAKEIDIIDMALLKRYLIGTQAIEL